MVSVLRLSLRVTEAQEEPTEQTQEQSLPSLLPLSIPTSIPTAQQREASPLPYSFPCISPSSRQGTVGPTVLPGQFLFLSGKEPTSQCRRCKRLRFNPWIGKILWRKASQRTPVFLSGESHGQRSLAGYCPWGHKESGRTEAHTHG